jgi:hypothetical protein
MRYLILACTGTSTQGEREVPVYLSEVGRVLHWNDMNEYTVLRRECRVGRAWDHMTEVSRMSPEVFYVWGHHHIQQGAKPFFHMRPETFRSHCISVASCWCVFYVNLAV